MKLVLTNENGIAVPRVGSALEADKKINLALEISVIVHAPKASWTTAQRRPVDVRGDGLPPAGGMSLARSARHVKVHQDASNPAGGQQNQAIGRTKGGLNTKLSAWVDSQGQPVSLSLAPRQAADVNIAQGAPAVAENDDCCRQGLRQRRVPGAIAAMGKPGLYSTPLQLAPAHQLAPRPLPQAAQGRELIPTIETQPEGWDTL